MIYSWCFTQCLCLQHTSVGCNVSEGSEWLAQTSSGCFKIMRMNGHSIKADTSIYNESMLGEKAKLFFLIHCTNFRFDMSLLHVLMPQYELWFYCTVLFHTGVVWNMEPVVSSLTNTVVMSHSAKKTPSYKESKRLNELILNI